MKPTQLGSYGISLAPIEKAICTWDKLLFTSAGYHSESEFKDILGKQNFKH